MAWSSDASSRENPRELTRVNSTLQDPPSIHQSTQDQTNMGYLSKEDDEKRILVEVNSVSPASSFYSDRDEEKATFQPRVPRSAADTFLDLFYILLNTVTTVAIVFLNKRVFSDPQLRACQVTIAIWHFSATFLVLYLASCAPLSLFRRVRLPLGSMVPLSAFFAGFLLLGNLSLAWNPIGFYQLARVLNTPVVVLLSLLIFQRRTTGETVGAITTCCVGVALTNSQLALSNPAGTAVALAAVLVTAMYQIWIGGKIEQLGCSAPQLLMNQAPVSVVLMACIAPFVDTRPDFEMIAPEMLWTVAASGVLAALLNLSQFQVIARTSALTFNIVSNLKTIAIVSISWYTERKILNLQDIVGVSLAVGGAYAYSQIKQRQTKTRQPRRVSS